MYALWYRIFYLYKSIKLILNYSESYISCISGGISLSPQLNFLVHKSCECVCVFMEREGKEKGIINSI